MNRFIRLDTMFHASPWLSVLSSEARLCWVLLLCYAKAHGRDGRVRALTPEMAARMWWVGEESVRQLTKAATDHGGIMLDGPDWIVAKWSQYQGDTTGAERAQRYRDRRKAPSDEPASRPSRVTPVTSREKEKEKEKDTNTPLIPPKKGEGKKTKAEARPASLSAAVLYFRSIGGTDLDAGAWWDHFAGNGWKVGKAATPMKDWQATARTWMRSPIRAEERRAAAKAPPKPKEYTLDELRRMTS